MFRCRPEIDVGIAEGGRMSAGLIGLTGVIYLGVMVSEFRAGHLGMSLVFFGYALANLGLLFALQ
jgi:hypothetical protein